MAHIVIWPHVKIRVGKKLKVLDKGDLVPDKVDPVDIANLTSFGAIAGVVEAAPSEPEPEPESESASSSAAKAPTIAEVMGAVGTDKVKAQEYLDEEQKAEKPRVTLVEQLRAVLATE